LWMRILSERSIRFKLKQIDDREVMMYANG